jgi:hypothetical protein
MQQEAHRRRRRTRPPIRPTGDAKMEGDAAKPDTAETDSAWPAVRIRCPRGTDEDGGRRHWLRLHPSPPGYVRGGN